MRSSSVYSLAIKDIREAFSSIEIYGPMIFIPLFFAITLPIFTIYVSIYAGPQLASRILGIATQITQTAGRFYFISFFSINILGPIFLTMPIITASVIAADSFAGEKERKTAESLLSTPITNLELIFGKILASLIPAIILTIVIFMIYAAITNYFVLKDFGESIFPNTGWYMMMLNAPFLALTTIGLVVIVSSRVKGIKEAQQISALLILPILIIPFISVFNIANLSFVFFVEMLLFLMFTSAVIIYIGVKAFERERFISA